MARSNLPRISFQEHRKSVVKSELHVDFVVVREDASREMWCDVYPYQETAKAGRDFIQQAIPIHWQAGDPSLTATGRLLLQNDEQWRVDRTVTLRIIHCVNCRKNTDPALGSMVITILDDSPGPQAPGGSPTPTPSATALVGTDGAQLPAIDSGIVVSQTGAFIVAPLRENPPQLIEGVGSTVVGLVHQDGDGGFSIQPISVLGAELLNVADAITARTLIGSGTGDSTAIADATENVDGLMPAGDKVKIDRMNFDTSAPSTGRYLAGDLFFNIQPQAGGNIGWVCIEGGTPGQWKEWGIINS